MNKSLALRASAFVGVAGLAVVLAGAAVSGTGAYFSDSAPGTVSATLGTIAIESAGLDMLFVDVLPGETRTGSATFTNTGSNPEDVWIVFDAAALAAVTQAGSLVSFELIGSNPSTPQSGPLADLQQQYLIHDNLGLAQGGTLTMTFTVSPTLTAGQGTTVALPFKIVATQDGILPGDINNSAP